MMMMTNLLELKLKAQDLLKNLTNTKNHQQKQKRAKLTRVLS